MLNSSGVYLIFLLLDMALDLLRVIFNEEGIDTWDDGIHPGRKADGWYFSYIRIILNAHSTYGTLIPCLWSLK